ncbi:MAG: VWA domain-containing protein [Blastocatellia bacterium]
MRFALFLLSCAIFFWHAAAIFAQDKPGKEEDEVVRVDTELVEVPLVVMDKAGKPVLNLKKDNFVIFEDGKRQDLTEFSSTNAPFEIALFLDTSGSTRNDLALIRRAAQNFVDSLRPGDRVAVISFRSIVIEKRAEASTEILAQLTSDRSILRQAIERLNTSNGTPYYDGIVKIADTVFAGEPKDEFRGRRALVALTDGVDSTSISDHDETGEKLGKIGIVNYFIKVDTRPFFEENLLGDCETALRFSSAQIRRYYASFNSRSNIERTSDFCRLGDFERLAISKRLYEIAETEMNSLAKSSGGRVFPVGDLSEARSAFKQVADEIGTKYSLGYYSSNEKRDGTYRKIRVELKGLPVGTQIRAREGYSAKSN